MKINKGKDPNREVQLQWEDPGVDHPGFYFITEHTRVKNTFGARSHKWIEDRIQLSDEEIDRLFEKVQAIRKLREFDPLRNQAAEKEQQAVAND